MPRSIELVIDVDAVNTIRALTDAPAKLVDVFRQLLRTTMANIHTITIYTYMVGGPSPTRLARRSGALIRAFRWFVMGKSLDTLEGTVWFKSGEPGTVYAGIHTLGTTGRGGELPDIRGQGKLLAIPFPGGPALTAGGRKRGGPRSGLFADTFVTRSRAGNLIIFGRTVLQAGPRAGETRGGRAVPLFVLKETVAIPPRIHLEDVAQKQVDILQRTMLSRAIVILQGKASGG